MFSNMPEIITVKELMLVLQISKSTALSLLKKKSIKAFKVGRDWRIPKKSLINYIEKSK